MSADNPNNPNNNSNNGAADMPRQRRSSITSSTFSNLFHQRRNSSSMATPVFPGSIASSAMNDQRRRLSITTLGLSGTSPTNSSQFNNMRRGSLSTNNSDTIEESAIDDEEMTSARTAPTTPYTRHMSFGATQAMRSIRTPGASSPGSNDQGFNWSEQLRSRAENSVVSGSRPSISFASGLNASPPRNGGGGGGAAPHHERAKSVSDMPAPPAQSPRARQPQKPDHFQERILKGDFYMD